MTFFSELFSNELFVSAAIAWFVAQLLKTIIHTFVTKDFSIERMYGSGGMPSSHSATVTALATTAYFLHGASSREFAISSI